MEPFNRPSVRAFIFEQFSNLKNDLLKTISFQVQNKKKKFTYQAASYDECTKIFDQLAVLSPIFAALTAASPVFNGKVIPYEMQSKFVLFQILI